MMLDSKIFLSARLKIHLEQQSIQKASYILGDLTSKGNLELAILEVENYQLNYLS